MNFTSYYSGALSRVQESSGFQFLAHGLLIIFGITALLLVFFWYDSREEMEDGRKVFNPMTFSKKLKNVCCFPESCQSSVSKCFIMLGVIGSSYLEVLQEEEAVRETRTLEKLMEARKLEKKKRRGGKKSSRSRNNNNDNSSSTAEYFSDDGESVHSGHGLL